MSYPEITIKSIPANGFQFTCRFCGKPEDEPIILLHGWPETSHMWEELMKILAMEGYYCIAPNLRGFSMGARPKGKANYSIDSLGSDVIEIINTLKISCVHLIGHDWGSVIGWWLCDHYEDRIQSFVGLSVPHLQAFGEALVDDPEQTKMSSYMKGFQLPYLPELRLKQNDYKVLRKLWKNSSSNQLSDYLAVFSSKGALRATVNIYRKNYKTLLAAKNKRILADINVPCIFIWGNKDLAIAESGVDEQEKYIKGPYELIKLEGAGHWLVQTNFADVKNAVLKLITQYPISK